MAGIDQTKRRRGEEVMIFAFDIQSINVENTGDTCQQATLEDLKQCFDVLALAV